MKIRNRQLEKAFNFSLSQVRRWAVLYLGRDPEADKGGGVRREYEVDDAFFIFLLGLLITEYKLGQKEAQEHIINISNKLKEEGLVPSQYDETIYNYHDRYDFGHPIIKLIIYPNMNYKIEMQLNYQKTEEGDRKICDEKKIVIEFNDGKDKFYEASFGPRYLIPLSAFIGWFRGSIH